MVGKKKIILIEDDPKSRFALHSVLQQHGHDVAAVPNAVAARDLGDLSFDVAIIDVRLPEELGTAFAAELRARHAHMRIVFITAYDDLERVGTSVAGAVILVKPIDMDALLKLLL